MVRAADTHIDPEKDEIYYRKERINCARFVYYMLYKPKGVVTAREDKINPTVFSLVNDPRPDLSAVGRLDKDTTGILLITNDGQMNHKLLSSKYHVPKTYVAEVDGILTPSDIEALESGIDIGDDTPTLPAKAEILAEDKASLTIIEGRYHQVKRMFAALDKPVKSLHRMSFGPLKLDEMLRPGEIRTLTDEEIQLLNKCFDK